MSEATKLQISIGAIAILDSIIGLPSWYKDEPKQGMLLCRAVSARDALPEIPPALKPEKDEAQKDFDARVEKWAEPKMEVEWNDKQKEAVKACVKFFLKQASFTVTKPTIELLRILGLDEE